ncbi:MAG: phosphotransferase [Xanthomonadales bacterium]|nr:phosphotransferase [Xanthomonadales bacterium]
MNEALTDIESRVPHAGAMVLIDEVVSHDEARITCRAHTGALAEHPLGRKGRLPGTALAEYGAQAMAVHGSLLAASGAAPREGRLVALPELELGVSSLQAPAELTIHAERVGGSAVGEVYEFRVLADDAEMARGRATVMFPVPGVAA